MDFDEFEVRLRAVRARGSASSYPEGFDPFDSWRATADDVQTVETRLDIRLPGQYRDFMSRYGGGTFLFLDLLPVVSPDGQSEDLLTVNGSSLRQSGFIAISPVGTGDWWGFPLMDGVCAAAVHFWYHDESRAEFFSEDFLSFLVRRGLSAGD
jgi:antitoxin YobK